MSAEKVDLLAMFPSDIGQLVLDYNGLSPEMPLQTVEKHSKLSPHNFILFKRLIDDAAVSEPLLTSVVQANPVQLIEQVRVNPGLLFKKGQKTDFAEQTFYNISAFQLMLFLCDADMLNQFKKIMPSIPKVYDDVMKKQRAEIDSGGADLVKMDRDPTTLPFEEVTRFTTSYNINGVPTAVTFPLLENPDGIIYYQEPRSKLVHLY